MTRLHGITFCLITLVASTLPADEPESDLPKVVLVGDSIRLSYAPIVAEQLAGKMFVVSGTANGGDSDRVLKNLDTWVTREKPDVVHFNCGIHDTKRFIATGKFQVSPARYEANLRNIVTRIRASTDAVVLFATSTPILDDRAAATRKGREYALHNSSIKQFNAIARRVMNELEVPVNHLHKVVEDDKSSPGSEDLIKPDGVHLTQAGVDLVGNAVAAFISTQVDIQGRTSELTTGK